MVNLFFNNYILSFMLPTTLHLNCIKEWNMCSCVMARHCTILMSINPLRVHWSFFLPSWSASCSIFSLQLSLFWVEAIIAHFRTGFCSSRVLNDKKSIFIFCSKMCIVRGWLNFSTFSILRAFLRNHFYFAVAMEERKKLFKDWLTRLDNLKSDN